jgi:predicted ABC-type ATPase
MTENKALNPEQLWQQLIDATQPYTDLTHFENLQQQARQQTKPQTQPADVPRLIHLCGLPGSGKTTYASQLKQTLKHFWHLQFDQIMQSLPAYQRALRQEGAAKAFAKWEKTAANTGYQLLKNLINEKRNILFDHSAAHPLHPQLILHCQSQGYQVEMHYLSANIDIVKERVQARESEINRHTPPTLIDERHQLLQTLLPLYRVHVDRFIRVGQ